MAGESGYGLFAPPISSTASTNRPPRRCSPRRSKKLAELDRYFHGEEELWRTVIEDAGIKAE
jgi:hypothetical protein